MKKNTSVEGILRELWRINEPVKKETPQRDPIVGKIEPEKSETEATALKMLREQEKESRMRNTKGKSKQVKSIKAAKKATPKKSKRAPVGALILSKERERHVGLSTAKVKIPTGIKGLDPLLGGGIEEGYSFIIYGTPHCGKKPAIMQIAYSALKQKIPVVFVLTDFGAKRWKEMMIESGWNMDRFKDRVYFIDAYSQQYSIMKNEENITYLQVPFPLSTLSIECTKFMETSQFVWGKKPLVIVHSISTLIQNFGENEVFNFLQFFLGKLGNESITSVHSLQAGMHTEKIETMIVSMLDGVLEMRDMKLRARGFLDIKTQEWIPYHMTSKGVVVEFKEEKKAAPVKKATKKTTKKITKKSKKVTKKARKKKAKRAKPQKKIKIKQKKGKKTR